MSLENDSGEVINLSRVKLDGKFVCPVIAPDGSECGRRVKVLWKHIENGHGPKGTFSFLSKSGY